MQKTSITVNDFQKICRICLGREDFTPAYDPTIVIIYRHLTDIEIEEEDSLPKNFCENCRKQLKDTSTFIETCKTNNEYLKTILTEEEQKESLSECENPALDSFEDNDSYEDADSPLLKEKVDIKTENKQKCSSKSIRKCRKKVNRKQRGKANDNDNSKKKRIEECYCNICGKKFTRKGGLKRHINVHQGIKPFECKICGKTFGERATLNRHNLMHTGEKPFECNLCGKASTRKLQIIEHISKHHPNAVNCDFVITEHKRSKMEEDAETEYDQDNKTIDKKECEDLKHNLEVLEDDQKDAEEDPNYKTELNKNSSVNGEVRQFKTKKRIEICLCNFCGKVFRRRGYLKNHMAIHAKIKPFECKVCGKGFTQRHALTRHNLVHTKERPFQCNLCGKTFTRKEILTEHLKNHEEGTKPYLCFHCGKCFSNKDYLSKHLKYYKLGKGQRKENSDAKKCICPHCGKQLHSVSYLKTHLLTHTGEKPFECDICGNKFTVQRSLNHHMNIHKGIKPYQCKQCEKAFRTSNSLRKHVLLHTGERPFKCTGCEKGFIRRSHLKRHLRTH